MPYKLSPDKKCVLNADGTELKCHPTTVKAKAHLIALNMNVPDAKSKTGPDKSTGQPAKTKQQKKEAIRRYLEAGARHSKNDSTMVQTIHDHAVELGAMCTPTKEARRFEATSYDQLREKARGKLNDLFPSMDSICWIAEMFDEYFIIELNYDEYWQVPYTVSGDSIEISGREQWQKVERQQSWVKASEAQMPTTESAKGRVKEVHIWEASVAPHLTEAEKAGDKEFEGKEWEITIIGPKSPAHLVTIDGKEYVRSDNGLFYAVEGLEASVPDWENIKIYDDHLTEEEFQARGGMRSQNKEWLGTIVSPWWDKATRSIKGIYKVVDDAFANKLKSAWNQKVLNSIGLSIDTFIKRGASVVYEGKTHDVAEGFNKIISCDVVGNPATGGGFDRMIAAMTSQQEAQ